RARLVHPQHEYGEPGHERGDREERGDARHRPARRGGDDQVTRPAEQRHPGALGDGVQRGQRRRRGRDEVLFVVLRHGPRRRLARPDPARARAVRRRPPIPPRGLDHIGFRGLRLPVRVERPPNPFIVKPPYPFYPARPVSPLRSFGPARPVRPLGPPGPARPVSPLHFLGPARPPLPVWPPGPSSLLWPPRLFNLACVPYAPVPASPLCISCPARFLPPRVTARCPGAVRPARCPGAVRPARIF